MPEQIRLKDANCTGLSFVAPVQLANKEEDKNSFLIKAYTGETVDRWWGLLAIDVDGIKSKEQIPVFMNHDASKIVGHSTRTYKDDAFFVVGQFSEVTEAAKEVKALSEEGFPWQASLGVRPVSIMSLEKEGQAEVNGKIIKGPAEIWTESEVFETSFVPLGADANTNISTFSKFEEVEDKHQRRKESMEITMETMAKDAPDLLAKIQADAEKAGHETGVDEGTKVERERVAALLVIEDADFASKEKAIIEGLTVEASYKLFFEAEKTKKVEELTILQASTPDSVGQNGKEKEADNEETFMSAVDQYQKENKSTRTEALQAVVKDKPALHKASFSEGGK